MAIKIRKYIGYVIGTMIFSFAGCGFLYAHPRLDASNRRDSLSSTKKKEIVDFKDRLGFRTNAFGWLALLPNVGVEFDLTNSVYNKSAILLNIRGNWRTSNTFKSYFIYNLWDARGEYRYYWRTSLRSRDDKMSFLDKIFSRKRFHPRSWRAYYLGGYATVGRYTLKLGATGRQGKAYGVGLSAGFGIPLYTFGGGALDFEFGANVGVAAVEYDEFKLNRSDDCYPVAGHKPLHIVPYPVIHDVQVSFVYRFNSIKKKYNRINERKIEARQERARQRMARKATADSLRAVRKLEKQAMDDSLKAAKDLLKAAKAQQKQMEKERKAAADSMASAVSLPEAALQGTQMPAGSLLPSNMPESSTPAVGEMQNEEKDPKAKKAKKKKKSKKAQVEKEVEKKAENPLNASEASGKADKPDEAAMQAGMSTENTAGEVGGKEDAQSAGGGEENNKKEKKKRKKKKGKDEKETGKSGDTASVLPNKRWNDRLCCSFK